MDNGRLRHGVRPGAGQSVRAFVPVLAFCLLACLLTAYAVHRSRVVGFDFRGNEWSPARTILEGRGPYHQLSRPYLRAHSNAFLLPPLIALLVIPIAVLPFH